MSAFVNNWITGRARSACAARLSPRHDDITAAALLKGNRKVVERSSTSRSNRCRLLPREAKDKSNISPECMSAEVERDGNDYSTALAFEALCATLSRESVYSSFDISRYKWRETLVSARILRGEREIYTLL